MSKRIYLLFLFLGIHLTVVSQINLSVTTSYSICPGSDLILDELNGSISGDVTDGRWITLGDGTFTPGNGSEVTFSSGLTYQPGSGDVANGGFNLILVSDYADPMNQVGQESAIVAISYQTAPSLACNSSLNLSLTENCEQLVTPQLVLASPSIPYDRYIIKLYDKNNQIILDNILQYEHIGQTITVEVSHDCMPLNSCWSEIVVADKNPPPLNCTIDTIACTTDIIPDSVGYPFDSETIIEILSETSFRTLGHDACTEAVVSYRDEEMMFTCADSIERVIFRRWTAIDEFENVNSCIQEIYVKRDSLASVTMPPNYDGIDEEALECGDDFPVLDNGYPSPDFTGYPSTLGCEKLEATFDDLPFERCGGYKILRKWFIIDWCTSETLEHNQIIKLEDTTVPIPSCPEDITISNHPYDCASSSFFPDIDLDIVDCSETTVTYEAYDSLGNAISINSDGSIPPLPVGWNEILYTITDECGNDTTCLQKVWVIDEEVPQVNCDEFTSVALGIDGTARLYATSVDDESWDNCQIDSMYLMKMTDLCNATDKGPYVEFCCEEVGMEIMVALTVTDASGNSNTCMVTVEVEDKLPPEITCPDNLTVSCDLDFSTDNLSVFGNVVGAEELRESIIIHDAYGQGVRGRDGIYRDNCTGVIDSSFTLDIECGEGDLIRTFQVTDNNGSSNSCQQVIRFVNLSPFNYQDIMWPGDYDGEACSEDVVLPEVSGSPLWDKDVCADIAMRYEDEFFPFAEGSCMKILRTWTVIDWCQYKDDEDDGKWSYIQVLKYENFVAPTITAQDSIICNYSEDCSGVSYEYLIEAEDDCTQADDMHYKWSILLPNLDTLYNGGSRQISVILENGDYQVHISVEDRCGNIEEGAVDLTVMDCKKPTPHCVSELTTVLMQEYKKIDIVARDFDFNSFDNCTALADLKFSFSTDVMDTIRTLTCDSIPDGQSAIKEYAMWITDESGNQEYCLVTIEVQDNNDQCEDINTGFTISGQVMKSNGERLNNVELVLASNNPEFSASEWSDEEGSYAFANVPSNYRIDVMAERRTAADEGISTLDIVKIQRHLLGIDEFNDPALIIAADVNGSGSINGIDILSLRKVLLKKEIEFPKDVPAWRFITNYDELTTSNALSFTDTWVIPELNQDENQADFIGVKMGDANFSASNEARSSTTEVRSRKVPMVLSSSTQGIEISIENQEDEINGFQIGIRLKEGVDGTDVKITSAHLELEPHHYNIQDGQILISWDGLWTSTGGVSINVSGLELEDIEGLSNGFSSEIYLNLNAYPLNIDIEKEESNLSGISSKLLGNPMASTSQIVLRSSESAVIMMQVISATGSVLESKKINIKEGENVLDLDRSSFPSSGLYYVQLQYKGWQEVHALTVL